MRILYVLIFFFLLFMQGRSQSIYCMIQIITVDPVRAKHPPAKIFYWIISLLTKSGCNLQNRSAEVLLHFKVMFCVRETSAAVEPRSLTALDKNHYTDSLFRGCVVVFFLFKFFFFITRSSRLWQDATSGL